MIPWYKPHFWGGEIEMVTNALESTWISDGSYIVKFESELSKTLGSRHVITTANGTASLMLAYLALEIGPGDEVIIPGFTFAAPANMALALGARPVFADIDPATWLLDPISVEKAITSNTRAIVAVHLYGNVCVMDRLSQIARKYDLFLIEDTAEAAFSTFQGKAAGTFGDFGSFSFQATKTITTGEGGAVCTDSEQLQDRARLYRNHGMRPGKRYWHEVIGYNLRLTNMQAALGYAQLQHYDSIVENKKRVYMRYESNLANCPGLELQKITPGCDPVIWAIVIKVDPALINLGRDILIDGMKHKGIETRPGFYPFSDMPLYDTASLEHSVDVAHNTISLPSYTMISDAEIDQVCDVFLALTGHR